VAVEKNIKNEGFDPEFVKWALDKVKELEG